MIISKKESNAINILRFICILFLLLHHSVIDHLVPESLSGTMKIVQQTITIPFLQILFILSGYLFFYQKNEALGSYKIVDFIKKTYVIKLLKRVRSLLLPYIIWCFVSIVYQIVVKHQVYSMHNPLDFVSLFWDTGSGHPVGMALWYVRNLIVFAILSPIYFIVVKFFGHLTVLLLFILASLKLPIDLPYFNVFLLLGSYLALSGISLEVLATKMNWLLCVACYIFLKTICISLQFDLNSIFLPFLLVLGIVGSLIKFEPSEFIKKVAMASTFIYFCHPYFTGTRNIYMSVINSSVIGFDIAIWFIQAATNFAICYCIYLSLKKFAPKLLGILQGNRG